MKSISKFDFLQGTDDVGSSYANALVDLAQEKNVLNDIHEDVETISVSLSFLAASSSDSWQQGKGNLIY